MRGLTRVLEGGSLQDVVGRGAGGDTAEEAQRRVLCGQCLGEGLDGEEEAVGLLLPERHARPLVQRRVRHQVRVGRVPVGRRLIGLLLDEEEGEEGKSESALLPHHQVG